MVEGDEGDEMRWDEADRGPAPWSEGTATRPILAVSECTGLAAQQMVRAAWLQFGKPDQADVTLVPGVRQAEEVTAALNAATRDGEGPLVVSTLGGRELCDQLASQLEPYRAPYINCVEPLLSTIEETFGVSRSGSQQGGAAPTAGVGRDFGIFVVSDKTGSGALRLVENALRQFPTLATTGVKVTICRDVRFLEEIQHLAHEAAAEGNTLVACTLASPGMSRFTLQRCKAENVPVVDLFQPLLGVMGMYLDTPCIGVAGGFDIGELIERKQHWETRIIKPEDA